MKIYSFLVLFIGIWWLLAFKKTTFTEPSTPYPTKINCPTLDAAITLINRDLLYQALTGDTELMARLISDWDIDAQILNSNGFEGIKRIPHSDFLRSQSLLRALQNDDYVKNVLHSLKNKNQWVLDDAGNAINLQSNYQKYLPQTYLAASLLLSLVAPSQIAGLPRHMREQTDLYPLALTRQIPLDVDRYNAEKLYLENPDVAFVAHFSHPATIQALINQGVLLYTMKNIHTIPDICQELIHLGHIVNKPLQAELMTIFINAAVCALDNQQTVLIRHFQQAEELLPKVLVVNFHQTFSVPTKKTLTGQLLSRMSVLDISIKYTEESGQSNSWAASIDKEKLVRLNPDVLIITTTNPKAASAGIHNDPVLSDLSAVRHNRLVFLDESVQHSISQYVVLAYHDLIQALIPQP